MKIWLLQLILVGLLAQSCGKKAENSQNNETKQEETQSTKQNNEQKESSSGLAFSGPEGSFAAAIGQAKEYPTLQSLVRDYVELGCGEVSKEAKDYPTEIGTCPGTYIMAVCGKVIINENCVLLLISYGCNGNDATGLYFYDVKTQKLNVGFNPKLKGAFSTPQVTVSLSGKFNSDTGEIVEFSDESNIKTGKTTEKVTKYSFDPFTCEFRLSN